jgi:hypothetical protein
MTFISVIFLCLEGTCGFIHTKELFYSEAECTETTVQTVHELIASGAKADGICIRIPGRSA